LERLLLIDSSGHGGNTGAGVMVEVPDPGMQAQKRLRSFPSLESKLLFLLVPCGTVRLLDDIIAAGRPDHLLIVDADQARNLPDRGSVAAELVGINHLWDVIFTQEAGQEDLRSFGGPKLLEENVEYEAVLIHSPPAGRRAQARPFCPRRASGERH